MNYTVKNEKGVQVGRAYATLDEATSFIDVNDGYAKGWYIEPLSESTDNTPRPQFLTEA